MQWGKGARQVTPFLTEGGFLEGSHFAFGGREFEKQCREGIPGRECGPSEQKPYREESAEALRGLGGGG